MEDNYGPDFDEDFLNQPPEYEDDIDDEEADLYFSTLNKQLNDDLEEDDEIEQENEEHPPRKRPQYSDDQPLGSHPLDGTPFYEVANPDCSLVGYVEVSRPNETSKSRRVLTPSSHLIDSILNSVAPAIPTMPDVIESKSGELWSEKYQPRSVLELLTENEHSKVVLAWLELWDECVFKRKKNYEFQLNDYYKSMMEREEIAPYLPKKKMLFLYGPSGVSKSSLAMICSLQVGYRPVLIDASEYPNAIKFKEALSEFVGTAKFSFRPELVKPVCLIVENIENASNDVIKYLTDEYANGKRSSRKKKTSSVRRPIIFISSNYFSASIRKLRPHCFVVQIACLNKKRAINRLEKICTLEGLNVKRHILIDLYEQCNCDLRQCLNNLQYLSSLWWKDVTFSKELNTRMSDFSIFDALNTILTTNMHYDGNKLMAPRRRAELISNMLSRRADVDTLYHAIFYNSTVVGRLRATQRLKICNLLSDDDVINGYMRQTQSWSLLRYTNTAAIIIHFSIAKYSAKRPVYNLGLMYGDKTRECRDIIDSCMEAMKPRYRISPFAMQLDFLPALNSIIQPVLNLTATQIQFCDPEETDLIHRIVDVMSFYGLSYSLKADNSGVELRLEPPIEVVCCYNALLDNKAMGTLNTNAKKFIHQLLTRKERENDAIKNFDQISVSQEKSNQQRVPGLALLGRGLGTSMAKDVVQITTTKLLYRQGNSQAIRIKILNKDLF